MATWKGSLLSIMGRVQLIKSLIHGMLVYSFYVYQWPMKLLKALDTWTKKIIWSGNIYTRKVCTVAWKHLCMPWEEGGLDLRSIRDYNVVLLLRLSWKCYAHDSQWSHLFRKWFFVACKPLHRHFKSFVWSGIRKHMVTIIGNLIWIIGSGEKINMWTDNWMGATFKIILPISPLQDCLVWFGCILLTVISLLSKLMLSFVPQPVLYLGRPLFGV